VLVEIHENAAAYHQMAAEEHRNAARHHTNGNHDRAARCAHHALNLGSQAVVHADKANQQYGDNSKMS
jgi:hypothetical protein